MDKLQPVLGKSQGAISRADVDLIRTTTHELNDAIRQSE
jgi:hypothetical protein